MRTYKVTWKYTTNYEAAKKVFGGRRDPLMSDHDDATMTMTVNDDAVAILMYLSRADLCTIEYIKPEPTDQGDTICDDCMLPLRECQCENWHSDDDDEPEGKHAHDAFTYCGECGEKVWLTGDQPAHFCDPETLRKRDEYDHPADHPAAICPVLGGYRE